MSVAVGNISDGTWASGTTFTVNPWTPNGPALMVVSSRSVAPEAIILSISGNNLTWTEIDTTPDDQGQMRGSIWKGIGTGTTGITTVTLDKIPVVANAIVAAFTGAASDPFEANFDENQGAIDNNDPLVSVQTLTNNAMLVGCLGVRGLVTYTLQGGETAIKLDLQSSPSGGNTLSTSMFQAGLITPPADAQVGGLNSISNNEEWVIFAEAVKPETIDQPTLGSGSGILAGVSGHTDLGLFPGTMIRGT